KIQLGTSGTRQSEHSGCGRGIDFFCAKITTANVAGRVASSRQSSYVAPMVAPWLKKRALRPGQNTPRKQDYAYHDFQ
ncbi:MAG: hypothetical protein AAFQ28_12555, partial [Pseudomonadota bacterium]